MKSTAREGKSSLLKAETGGDPLLAEGQSPDANRENLLAEAKSGRKRGMKRAVKRAGAPALIHTDCVQAYGKIPLSVKKIGADLITVSSHKIHI